MIKVKDEICSVAFKVAINAFSNSSMGFLSYLIVFFFL